MRLLIYVLNVGQDRGQEEGEVPHLHDGELVVVKTTRIQNTMEVRLIAWISIP
jgi:hypothetical protein